jgi:hypothetical protein
MTSKFRIPTPRHRDYCCQALLFGARRSPFVQVSSLISAAFRSAACEFFPLMRLRELLCVIYEFGSKSALVAEEAKTCGFSQFA